MKILLIGGTGDFGLFYAKQFKEAGHEVSINGRDTEYAKTIAEKNDLGFAQNEKISEFDCVIISVPNECAPKTIKEIAPSLKKGALIFDFCSVKKGVVAALEKLKNREIEIASIHPMHGPRIDSIAGFPVACIQIKKGKRLEEIEKFFINQKANLFYSTAEEHDKALSIVQGLTHYSQFVSAAVLKEMEINLKEVSKFATPNFTLFISTMARVILQNPELYAQIQLSNPNNKEVRKIFSKQSKLLEKLCSKKSSEELKKFIINETQVFKDPDSYLFESDRTVNAINLVLDNLKRHTGHRFLVENMLTKSLHYGKIKEVTPNDLILSENQAETKIHLSKLRLTTKEEMLGWKKKNLNQKSFDYSILVPVEADPKIIINALSCVNDVIIELIDEFNSPKLPEGKKSLTIRAHFFEDDDKKEIDSAIKKFVHGLGYTLR
jgi:prephenate dehydrogenase